MKASPHRAAPCGAQPPGSSMNAIPPFAHLCEPAASLEDGHGRTVRYIRLSVTDRCNLRCTYCMPREVFGKDFVFLPRAELLSFEEIERVAPVIEALAARVPVPLSVDTFKPEVMRAATVCAPLKGRPPE